jgi:hypothetical protein
MTERIKLLDDLGTEFARVANEAEREGRGPSRLNWRLLRTGGWVRMLSTAVGVAVLIGGVAYAVPVTRTVVDGAASSFAAWVSGDDDAAPGQVLGPDDDVPSWFNADGEARLIAKTDGVGLYARRSDSDEGPYLEFGLGEGAGLIMGASLETWRQKLDQHAVHVLGTALIGPRDVLDEEGRTPLLGLINRKVKRVELRYADGPPLIRPSGDGGFVLLADAWRPLRELIVYDGSGRVLERIDMSDLDLRYLCDKDPVCPADRSSSSH